MNRRTILQSGLVWLTAAGHAKAADDEAPEGMVHIPGGEFVMGSPNAEAGGRGGPGRGSHIDSRHTVRLTDFHIGRNLVTNAEYKAFCDAAGARYRPGGGRREGGGSYWDSPDFNWAEKANHPVLWVGYNQAMDYCGWLSARTAWSVTLPSEAQWERAARGVTKTGEEFDYPWGNTTSAEDYRSRLNFNVLCAVKNGTSRAVGGTVYPFWPFVVDNRPGSAMASNFKGVVYGEEDTHTDIHESSEEVKAVWRKIMSRGGYTTAVGSYPAGSSGCFDMAGNAFEWTRDFSTVSGYLRLAEKTADPCVDDVSALTAEDRRSGSDGMFGGPGSGGEGRPTKIIRGGSWYANESSCKTHRRTETRAAGNGGYHSVGFRVTATPKR
jgi:formylglycine-generating enzyme required for sulfatase activity